MSMENELKVDFVRFEERLKALLQEEHIRIETTIEFPQYEGKELPTEIKLALEVLGKAGGVMKPRYIADPTSYTK